MDNLILENQILIMDALKSVMQELKLDVDNDIMKKFDIQVAKSKQHLKRGIDIDALRKLMKEKKVSQTDLCRNVGISDAALSHYMHGNRFPKLSTIEGIANYLGCPPEAILVGKDLSYYK